MTTRPPSIAFCMAQFGLVRLGLRTVGFGRTLAHFERPLPVTTYPISVDDPMVGQVAHAISAAAALYPGRARCLEQSFVLSRELRRRGAAARVRFGVHPYPFGAHAWVEVDRRAVNEDDDYMHMFTPLED